MAQKKVVLVLEPVTGNVRKNCANCKHFIPNYTDKNGVWGECWFDKNKLFRALPEYGCIYYEPKAPEEN